MHAAHAGNTAGIFRARVVVIAGGGGAGEACAVITGIEGGAWISVFAEGAIQWCPGTACQWVTDIDGAAIAVIAGNGFTAITFALYALSGGEACVAVIAWFVDGNIHTSRIWIAGWLRAFIAIIAIVGNSSTDPIVAGIFRGAEITIVAGALIV